MAKKHFNTGRKRPDASLRLTTHGMSKTPEYKSWLCMRERCFSVKNKSYNRYGGRGITVCEKWNFFQNFIDDIGCRPSSDYSIERHDNNKGYTPCNTYWADRTTQANNRITNRVITHNGEALTCAQWAKRLGGSPHLVDNRVRDYGWSESDAVTVPVGGRRVTS